MYQCMQGIMMMGEWNDGGRKRRILLGVVSEVKGGVVDRFVRCMYSERSWEAAEDMAYSGQR